MRRLEQHAGPMLALTRRAERGPCGVLQSKVERFAVRRLVLLPARHVLRERELGERLAEQRFELPRERRSVDAVRFVRLDLVHRFALHEVALHAHKAA